MNELLKLMHDTMSPVATIKGAVGLLKKGCLSPEETAKMLVAIETRADLLNKILDAYITQKEKYECILR
jgi:hypothetical protein